MTQSHAPGPGQYSGARRLFEISQSKKGYSFSKSKSVSHNKRNIPGPGSYNARVNTFKKTYGFISKGKRTLGPKIVKTPGFHNLPSTIPNVAPYNYPAMDERKIKL